MRSWGVFAAFLLMAAVVSTCTTSRRATAPAHRATVEQPAAPAPKASAPAAAAAATAAAPDSAFERSVRPILEKHCRPCHFEGGVMHEKLPFDRAGTIRTLGERLFTRIKDPEEQESFRAFLRQPNSR
jgi:cytochrome c5